MLEVLQEDDEVCSARSASLSLSLSIAVPVSFLSLHARDCEFLAFRNGCAFGVVVRH